MLKPYWNHDIIMSLLGQCNRWTEGCYMSLNQGISSEDRMGRIGSRNIYLINIKRN